MLLYARRSIHPDFVLTKDHAVVGYTITSAVMHNDADVPWLELDYSALHDRTRVNLHGRELCTWFMQEFGVSSPNELKGKKVLEVNKAPNNPLENRIFEGLVPQ